MKCKHADKPLSKKEREEWDNKTIDKMDRLSSNAWTRLWDETYDNQRYLVVSAYKKGFLAGMVHFRNMRKEVLDAREQKIANKKKTIDPTSKSLTKRK